ncbi:MAG: histidinol-phosphate transaminase [Eggerthellaceae bacterium]|nr:histidinol-phosphate transaminase [Eggerthellaceae bacterium]
MNSVRASAPQLEGLVPYDPKYLPAQAMLSANENPCDIDGALRDEVMRAVAEVAFNRYPDPLANELRDMIAEANGLSRDHVLVGNGGDELLFNLALAWGGPGRKLLNVPPTFSVYAANARLTGTEVVNVARGADFAIDEEAVIERLSRGDIDFAVLTSPNNPTGELASEEFIVRMLEASDALVLVDEAYFEFAGRTVVPLLAEHENLIILRTFSKAYSLAGVRLGYVMASPSVIRELIKVRQPYSVDAVSQAIARVVYANRAAFDPSIKAIVAERTRVFEELSKIPGVKAYPSDANYILFRVEEAASAWDYLYDRGVLIRDFSASAMLEGTLRVTIGTAEQNDAFLGSLRDFIDER